MGCCLLDAISNPVHIIRMKNSASDDRIQLGQLSAASASAGICCNGPHKEQTKVEQGGVFIDARIKHDVAF